MEDPMFCGGFRHDVIYDVMTSLTAIYRQTCQKGAHARTVKNHAYCLVFSLSFHFSLSLSDDHCRLDPLFLCLSVSIRRSLPPRPSVSLSVCVCQTITAPSTLCFSVCLCLSDAHCLLDPLFLCLSVFIRRSLPPRPSVSLSVCVCQTITAPSTLCFSVCLCLSDDHCPLDPLFLCLSVSVRHSLLPRPSVFSVCVSQTLTASPTLWSVSLCVSLSLRRSLSPRPSLSQL